MYLEKLSLHNYRGIRDMEIEFDRHLNVFVGDNGCGKSSIIDAAGNGLFGSKLNHMVGDEKRTHESLLFIYDVNIYANEDNARFVLDYNREGNSINVVGSSDPKELSSTLKEYFPRVDFLEFSIFEEDRGVGVFENHPDLNTFESLRKIDPRFSIIANRNAAFARAFDWLKIEEGYEDKLFRKHIMSGGSIENFDGNKNLQAVKNAIRDITGFSDVSFNVEKKFLEVHKSTASNELILGLHQLSLGERVFIGLVAAIAYNIIISSKSDEPFDAEHLVIIDEIDLHLHPKWQRRIVPALRETFPNCQFIITTHSPQVLSEVPADNIFILYRDENGDIQCGKPMRSKGLTVSEISTEVMGDAYINEDLADKLKEIYINIENAEFDKARKGIDELESELGQIPALIEARTMLELSE